MTTDLDHLALTLAGRPVHGSWDRIRRYCGLPWSGGPPETWAFPYYDAIVTDPETLEPVDVLATSALHVGLTRPELSAFSERRADLEQWLAAIPASTHLADQDGGVLELLHALPTFDERISTTLLAKVLHRKRPHLVPLVDRDVLDHYRPVTGVRSAIAAWRPLLDVIAGDLDRNAEPLNAMASALDDELGTALSPLRLMDLALWTRSMP
jgi:hypothetical protein